MVEYPTSMTKLIRIATGFSFGCLAAGLIMLCFPIFWIWMTGVIIIMVGCLFLVITGCLTIWRQSRNTITAIVSTASNNQQDEDMYLPAYVERGDPSRTLQPGASQNTRTLPLRDATLDANILSDRPPSYKSHLEDMDLSDIR